MTPRPLPALLALCCLIGTTQCGDDRVVIDVSIGGRSQDVRALNVSANLGDQLSAQGVQTVSRSLDSFVVNLNVVSEPPEGLLALHVSGVGAGGCQIAYGDGTVPINGPGRYSVTIPLDHPEIGCQLMVMTMGKGTGTVTSSPPRINCGTQCSAMFGTIGDTVALSAQTQNFGGWYGGCMGDDPNRCTVTIGSGVTRVTADFLQNPCPLANWCAEESIPVAVDHPDLNGIWGTVDRNNGYSIWAVGNGGILLRGDGIAWSPVPVGTTVALNAVWGSGPSDGWAVGDMGTILRWNGSAWSTIQSGTNAALKGVWASTAGDAWAVGQGGTILRWNGSQWALSKSGTTNQLNGIWGSGPQSVWAVGEGGLILKWDGTGWAPEAHPPTNSLNGVWGTGADNVWFVGQDGAIVRLTIEKIDDKPRENLQIVPGGTLKSLHAIWGSGANDIWAVGEGGMGLRWNGTTWESQNLQTTNTLSGLWGDGAGYVWAIGSGFTIIRYRP